MASRIETPSKFPAAKHRSEGPRARAPFAVAGGTTSGLRETANGKGSTGTKLPAASPGFVPNSQKPKAR